MLRDRIVVYSRVGVARVSGSGPFQSIQPQRTLALFACGLAGPCLAKQFTKDSTAAALATASTRFGSFSSVKLIARCWFLILLLH